LYTQDGRTAQQILGRGVAGVDAAILGVIDEIDFGPAAGPKA
jgi:microcompartment protein CcmK/EutM